MTAKIKSRRAGELFSARWLYTFSKVPFYCLQQRKMERFSPRQKLTHTLTYTRKCAERLKEERTDTPSAPLF